MLMADQVKVEFSNGEIRSYDYGTKLVDIVGEFQPSYPAMIVAALVNNVFSELNYVLKQDSKVSWVDMTDQNGIRVYYRSLCLVFLKAASTVLPGSEVRFEHSLSKGIYGEIRTTDGKPLTGMILSEIEKEMKKIIDNNLPVTMEKTDLDSAIRLFKEFGHEDKVRLLRYKERPELKISYLDGYLDYFFGYTVPFTGYLKHFELRFYLPGFILRFPSREHPNEITPFREQRKLARVFYEYEKMNQYLNIEDVGSLNECIADGKAPELIRIAEALNEKKIAQIADMITAEKDRNRIILIAGPSSSSKTTFAQRLSIQLRVNGLRPVSVSVDDYFVNRSRTPLDEDGKPDFECLEAIDTALFNDDLANLVQGLPVYLPRYNFQKGERETRDVSIKIDDDQPLIIEGIHALNDRLTSEIPQDNKFKIYISALTSLNIDNHNRIPTTDNRIIRRIVRDNQFRGHDAKKTIDLWPSVRRGEEKHIFPFQEGADVMFNSALIYELAVLKVFAEPLLQKITPDMPEYAEAKRLLKFLSYFLPLDASTIPTNSLIREFIGGSCF